MQQSMSTFWDEADDMDLTTTPLISVLCYPLQATLLIGDG